MCLLKLPFPFDLENSDNDEDDELILWYGRPTKGIYALFPAVTTIQFVIFILLSYCFEETRGFDVKTSFPSRLVSRLVRWYNKRILRNGSGLFMDWKLETVSEILTLPEAIEFSKIPLFFWRTKHLNQKRKRSFPMMGR